MTKNESAKLTVGQPVIIGERNYYGRITYREAAVTKVGRVWVEIKAATGNETWKMRQDTQNEATGRGLGGDFFRTLEQHEQALASAEARAYLMARGIEVRRGDFSSDAGMIDLAAAVKALLNG